MYRAFVAIGVIIDLLMVGLLIIVFGWIIDSWHDRNPWAGPVVTTCWAGALILSAGGPILAYVLGRRKAAPERIVLAVWGPPLVLVGLTVIGFVVFTPKE
jgi:hypothetical protein